MWSHATHGRRQEAAKVVAGVAVAAAVAAAAAGPDVLLHVRAERNNFPRKTKQSRFRGHTRRGIKKRGLHNTPARPWCAFSHSRPHTRGERKRATSARACEARLILLRFWRSQKMQFASHSWAYVGLHPHAVASCAHPTHFSEWLVFFQAQIFRRTSERKWTWTACQQLCVRCWFYTHWSCRRCSCTMLLDLVRPSGPKRPIGHATYARERQQKYT